MAAAVLGVNALSHLRTAVPDYREALVTSQRPLSLNPFIGADDPGVRDIGEMLYRRLLVLDDHALPVPDLATGVTVSADGLTYHLPLRLGQRWSDGRPLTAADVVATVAWVQSPHLGGSTTAAPWQDVHVRQDADGVSFDLPAPRASFAAALTQLPILPVGTLSAAELARLPALAAQGMATSGPFRVANAAASRITLFPNPYAPRRPRVNQVEIDVFPDFTDASAAFRRGDVDGLLATDPAERASLIAAGGTAHDIVTFRFVDLLFNERVPQLADPVVRQAVATTLDRGALVKQALGGAAVPQSGALPAGFAWLSTPPAAAAPLTGSQPAAALQALLAAGWTRNQDGVLSRAGTTLSLDLAVADVVPLPALAAAVGRQLAAVGFRVTISPLPAASIRSMLAASPPAFQMALADWDTGPDPDVSSFWRSTATPPQGFNVAGGPVDPFLDQALDRLATLTDPMARRTAAAAVSTQLAEDLPAVFLDTPQVSLVVRPGLSVTVPPVGDSGVRFADVADWHRG